MKRNIFRVTKATLVSRAMRATALASDSIMEARLRTIGKAMVINIRARAPRDTGQYAKSIQMEIRGTGRQKSLYVGTRAAQGRRLEFGFNGVDSLGRRYNDPPRPHFGPGAQATQDGLERLIRGGDE